MLIPYQMLEADTLHRLIEDFVTREGTDNGDDTPLATRVARVQQALKRRDAVIAFASEHQQCQLMLRRLDQAFAHCPIFPTAASRRSLEREGKS